MISISCRFGYFATLCCGFTLILLPGEEGRKGELGSWAISVVDCPCNGLLLRVLRFFLADLLLFLRDILVDGPGTGSSTVVADFCPSVIGSSP